jgi:hypothetical protein
MSQTHIPAAIRRLVRERAENRCEYCLIPEQATFAPHWMERKQLLAAGLLLKTESTT